MRTGDGIWRALQGARRRNLDAAGAPPPVAGHEGQSRRSLLKALAAGGIATATGAPARLAAAPPRSVAIIGGGIAGLSALHHLVAAGVDARLYEARARLGGRMHTVTAPDGTRFERGGQLVNSDHADMRALLAATGIALVDRKAAAHRTMILADGRLLGDGELVEGLRAIAARIDRDAKALDADFAGVAPSLDRLSMAQYLDQYAALLPRPWARALLEQTARTEYGVEPAEASALELLFNLPVVDGRRVEVLGGSDERFVIAGGSSALVDALAARHRDRIATGRWTRRIAARRDGRLEISFREGAPVLADEVIVAVPPALAGALDLAVPLPATWRRFLSEARLGRCEKLQWAMARTPWRDTLGAGGEGWSADPASPAALVWEGTIRGGAASAFERGSGERPVWNWFFGGAQVDGDPPPEALARAFAPIAAGLDGARTPAATANRTTWHRDPLTQGAYSNYAPGQLTRFAGLFAIDDTDPAERQYARAGRVHFAGEHLSDAYPGYMNGAAQTGRMAAQAIAGVDRVRLAA